MAIPVLPPSAPFTPAQRAWLNGFFAGALSLDLSSGTVVNAAQPASNGTDHAALVVAEPEEAYPWHDPALSLDERSALAEGRPLEQKLMAAMAQLDCGTCGYVCTTYARAIAHGDEKDLTRCTPGGTATTRRLKELMASATS